MTSEEALRTLLVTLEQLQRLLPTDKATWDRDLVIRLAVERLWITAGNAADEYRRAGAIDLGVEPWSELVAYRHRLAHALPGDLSEDRIWADTTADLPRMQAAVRGALETSN